MDLQTRKIEFVQKFLKIQNEELITQLENLLKKNRSSESLAPMSIEELNARIDQSEKDFKAGNFKTSTEILGKFK